MLLLDIRLPDASGLEVNRWLAEHHPEVRVVMLTMSEDLDNALTALRDGASGYLVKGAGPERVEHAIRTVASGDVVLDHSLAQGVTELAQVRRGSTSRPFPQLTNREFDILQLLAEGLDNATIARRLFLSPKTVRNHVSNVFAKIQAPGSTRRHRPRPPPRPRNLTAGAAFRSLDKPVDHEEWRDNTHSPHRDRHGASSIR